MEVCREGHLPKAKPQGDDLKFLVLGFRAQGLEGARYKPSLHQDMNRAAHIHFFHLWTHADPSIPLIDQVGLGNKRVPQIPADKGIHRISTA